MKHLDLFSGIGCWALASAEVWPDREMVGFCEIDPFCRAVLTQHFPDVPIYGDIKTLADAGRERRQQKRRGTSRDEGTDEGRPAQNDHFSPGYDKNSLDLLTASPPCQAASSAGRRKGTKDDRWLWPATFEVIARTRPRWVVLENVRGLLSLKGGLVFDDLLARMEKDGYEVWPFVAPAAGVGAPHQRARVWIVARRVDSRGQEHRRGLSAGQGRAGLPESGHAGRHPANAAGARSQEPGQARERQLQAKGGARLHDRPQLPRRREWEQDWREVALATCHDRVDDGVPGRVYGPDRISEAAHRRERLKACGNAIVPQVAVEIMRAIKEAGL